MKTLFLVAAFLSAALALLHIVVIFAGAPAYRYFGAGEEMARLDEQGSWRPAAITGIIAIVFAIWSAYAFSGAGAIPKLPLLKTGLAVIGAIYTLRGLSLFAQLARLKMHRGVVFSAVSLVIGVVYLTATALLFRRAAR